MILKQVQQLVPSNFPGKKRGRWETITAVIKFCKYEINHR